MRSFGVLSVPVVALGLACAASEMTLPPAPVPPPSAAPVPRDPPPPRERRPSRERARGEVECRVAVEVPGPDAIQVHTAPGGDVIATIAHLAGQATALEVIESKDDWLRISRASTTRDTTPFEGDGWVRAQGTTVDLYCPECAPGKPKSVHLRARPSDDAEVVATVDGGTLVVEGCREGWLKGTTRGERGWVSGRSMCPVLGGCP